MAGRTLDEARAAFRATQNRGRADGLHNRSPHAPTQTVHITTSPPTTITSLSATAASPPFLSKSASNPHHPLIVNGQAYIPDPNWNTAHITEISPMADMNNYQYHTFVALSTDNPSIPTSSALSATSTHSSTNSPNPSTYPFIFNTGATCHISPFLSDFESITPITPHPIKGLGEHFVCATGIGTIILETPSGSLTLNKAFYVPDSSVHLISVFLLGDSHYNAHFYPSKGFCIISDAKNSIIAHSTALTNRKLFTHSDFTVHVPHSLSNPSSAHYTSRPSDVDTWHKQLGHCDSCTVIDMARNNVVKGMSIDLSSLPPKCEHYILGKQTRSSVPKTREGTRADKPLDWIYIDLCGPMSIASHSGCMYSMNIIDDFSSFIWSIPLRSKNDAAPILKTWLTAVELQTPHWLCLFVTDNGELATIQIQNWCHEQGILHLFTVPYMSAHNGHAEHLHHTLMNKA